MLLLFSYQFYLQLNEFEHSFFGYDDVTPPATAAGEAANGEGIAAADVDAVADGVTVDEVAADGVRNNFLGTDTHPPFSPSFDRANSRINLPSENFKRFCISK